MKKSLLLGLGAVTMAFATGAGIGIKHVEDACPKMVKAGTVYTFLIEHKVLWDGVSGGYQLKVDGTLYDPCATAFETSNSYSVFEIELEDDPAKIQPIKGDNSGKALDYVAANNTIWCPDSLGTDQNCGAYHKSLPDYTPTFTATFANAVPEYVDIQLGANFYGFSLTSMSATDGATRKHFSYSSSLVRCWSGTDFNYKVLANYSGVFDWSGTYTKVLWDNGNGGNASFQVDAATKPLFYSALDYTSSFVFSDYFFENGTYLRGSVIGWDGADQIPLSGSGPYTIKRSFEANEKVQAVRRENGVVTWIAAKSATPADANYFPVSVEGSDAKVTHAGTYTLSLTAEGTYLFTDTASEWCRTFLNSMTCDPDGLAEPEFKAGYSWSSLSDSFGELDDIAKDAIHDAVANPSGSVIQEAASRYDTIVSNHKYTRFIENSSHELRSAKGVFSEAFVNNNDSPLIISVAVIGLTSLLAGGLYLVTRRARRQD